MSSKVYFTDLKTKRRKNLLDKIKLLFDKAGFGELIKDADLVAVKLHWGEEGNTGFISPLYVKAIVDKIKERKGRPFLTDTNTLYRRRRQNGVDNISMAIEHGFSMAGAPIVIADGLIGLDYVKVPIGGKHFKEVKIASGIYYSQALICITHLTGHELFGFGGTLKNLGMGCGSPGGKQQLHSDLKPKVDEKKCIGCKTCMKWCPAGAISLAKTNPVRDQRSYGAKKARIDPKRCIGCGECIALCPERAIPVQWDTTGEAIQEKTAEYAWGAVKDKKDKCGYFSFLINISPDCDCLSRTDPSIVQDLGILASLDPVALEQASVDLVNKAKGLPDSKLGEEADAEDKFFALHGVRWHHILDYAERIGLGSRRYDLVEVD